MQSLTEVQGHSTPDTTVTTEPHPDPKASNEPEPQKMAGSEAHTQDNTVAAAEGSKTCVEGGKSRRATAQIPPAPLSPGSTQRKESGFTAKTATSTKQAPNTKPKPGSGSMKEKKEGKKEVRKYVLSKKAMIDPLKMDMSKPVVMPLTSEELSLQCLSCHIIFQDDKSKVRHLKISHPLEYENKMLSNSLFTCYVCDHPFTNSLELRAHQKSHTEETPFKCPVCGEAFKTSSELTAHKRGHLVQGSYTCNQCGKSCKTLTLLKYHNFTHTGEKPYECKKCGKRFNWPRAYHNHMDSHLSGLIDQDGNTRKNQLKKKDGSSTVRYPCSFCKASFKTLKSKQRHMESKHSLLPGDSTVGKSAPIITPISITQPALLQVEPIGPLQKVDANIDTEQIRRIIESMENIQKVNQVVILGQVPPHAPPLEIQQPSLCTPSLNTTPPKVGFTEVTQTDISTFGSDTSNNLCDPMEQTIILEPITPDGQLINGPFSDLASHLSGQKIELALVQDDQTENPAEEVTQQIEQQSHIDTISSATPMAPRSEGEDLNPNLEQTVTLALTPALSPTTALEQLESVPQNDLSPTSAPEISNNTAGQTDKGEDGTDPTATSCVPSLELELTSLHGEQQVLSSSSPPTQSELDSHAKESINSPLPGVNQEQISDVLRKTQDKNETDCNAVMLNKNRSGSRKQELSAKKKSLSQIKAKPVTGPPEVPVNVMSAQELVKVRKRKPARTFIFQGSMQDLLGSMYEEDLRLGSKPAKRKRTKESHLLVKFSPQTKGAKNKKEKKLSETSESVQESLSKCKTPKSVKKAPPQKKTRKGSKNATAENVSLVEKVNRLPLAKVSPLQKIKGDSNKSKSKKQKEVLKGSGKQKPVALPMFKKKKQAKKAEKEQAKNAKVEKSKADLPEEGKMERVDLSTAHIAQDCLLLLKGHKQPQLKVYKLDPSKASGQASDPLPPELQTHNQSNTKKQKDPLSEPTAESKKKGGRTKKNTKALSLLSSLKMSQTKRETQTTKPKTTRKRKSSSKLEAEGIITSSKRLLECKECGEIFSEVSSLQKHKTTVHVVESPSLTYTNGNIFEGVSNVTLYQLPKSPKSVHVMNAVADWDTEPEIAMEDRERNVSFPALIPSPSLPIPPENQGSNCYEDTGSHVTETDPLSHITPELELPKTLLNSTPHFSSDSSSKSPEMEKREELLPPEDEKLEQNSQIKLASESGVVGALDDDFKEELLLEVDLVTVGEKSEKEDLTYDEVSVPQSKSNENSASGESEPANHQEPEERLTLQTVSCSTQRTEVKEEEEEMLVEGKKDKRKGSAREKEAGGVRRGKKSFRKDVLTKRAAVGNAAKEMHSETDHSECRVASEQPTVVLGSDQETNNQETNTLQLDADQDVGKCSSAATTLPSSVSTSDCSPEEEPVVLELKSVTTSVHGAVNEAGLQGGEDHGRESGQSPVILLEKFLTSRQRASENEPERMTKEPEQGSVSTEDNTEQSLRSPTIKAEEQSLARQNGRGAGARTQDHQDVRTVLVKEESSVIQEEAQNTNGNKRIRWNVEPISNEEADGPANDSLEVTADSRSTPEFSSSQCIFYPVKVEEREMPVGVAHPHTSSLNPRGSTDSDQMEHHTAVCHTHEGSHAVSEYQQTRVQGLSCDPGDTDCANNQDSQCAPNLREFLLLSSDEDDGGPLEQCGPQIDSEEEIMSRFNLMQTEHSRLQDQTSPNLPSSSHSLQAPTSGSQTSEPIDYFCKYFGWDTWVEIADCTNRSSRVPPAVTPTEVAHFVGIHIAMGTLKFPCSKLYWEDLTKVPLIAEAMELSRFQELSHRLKLNSPTSTSATDDATSPVFQNEVRATASPGSCNRTSLGDQTNETATLHTQSDPLWKVQPLLRRFKAGCQANTQEEDYAVDHYPLELTGKKHSHKISLYCTTLIGFNGSLSRVELTLNFADKEDAVEKMVPKGSMVFLCRQELSTPAMLERLLAAGVNGAGMVGGSRGQVGDEFVSSDGRLMLRRSHRGFILSTAGSSLKSMASLIENFEKAQILARLNKDLQDLYTTPFSATVPNRWPQAVLWYLTDLALVNSWLQYRQEHRANPAPLTLMAFRLEVSKALIFSSGSDSQDAAAQQSRTEQVQATDETSNSMITGDSPLPDTATRYDGSGHWPEQLGEGEGGRCRFGDCQRMSRVLCLKCCVFLCISRNHNCFLNFHNLRSLEKE